MKDRSEVEALIGGGAGWDDAGAAEKTSALFCDEASCFADSFDDDALLDFELPSELNRRRAAAAGRRIFDDREDEEMEAVSGLLEVLALEDRIVSTCEDEMSVEGDLRDAWGDAAVGLELERGLIRGIRDCDRGVDVAVEDVAEEEVVAVELDRSW